MPRVETARSAAASMRLALYSLTATFLIAAAAVADLLFHL